MLSRFIIYRLLEEIEEERFPTDKNKFMLNYIEISTKNNAAVLESTETKKPGNMQIRVS